MFLSPWFFLRGGIFVTVLWTKLSALKQWKLMNLKFRTNSAAERWHRLIASPHYLSSTRMQMLKPNSRFAVTFGFVLRALWIFHRSEAEIESSWDVKNSLFARGLLVRLGELRGNLSHETSTIRAPFCRWVGTVLLVVLNFPGWDSVIKWSIDRFCERVIKWKISGRDFVHTAPVMCERYLYGLAHQR